MDDFNEFNGWDADKQTVNAARRYLGVQTWLLWGSDGVGDVSAMTDTQLIGLWYAMKLVSPDGVKWDVDAAREAVKTEMLSRNLPL